MRLAAALLLSAGAHFGALSVAERLGASDAGAAPPAPPPLRAALTMRAAEPAPAKPAAAPPPAPAPKPYLAARELDVRPQIRTHVMPRYPAHVPPGTRGRVVLELLIGADGRVDAVNVERAEPGGLFEQAAVEAFAAARFAPAMKRGVPVPALLRVEVSFGG